MTTIKARPPRKKKCKQCKKFFQPTRPIQPCCQYKCELAYALEYDKKKANDHQFQERKRIKKEAREARKAKREYRDNNYPIQFDMTKTIVQRWAGGIRDAGNPCMSCGTTADVQYCGGHYRTAGGNPELSLDTRNIHRQCNKNCNMHLSGNIYGHGKTKGYRAGLIEVYGQDYVDWLDGPHKAKNYTCDQLREIRAYYAKLTRDKIKTDEDRPYP